jgi:hypothetical protein
MERAAVQTGCNYVQTPAFSPRGDYLAWQCAEKISNVSIHLQRLSDGSVTQLLNGSMPTRGGWHGREMAAASSSALQSVGVTYGRLPWLDPITQKSCPSDTMLMISP